MKTFNSIRAASIATGIGKDIFTRGKLHPDSPKGLLGFHPSGRIYFTDELEKWLAAHRQELEHPAPNTLEHWQLLRLKWQTLALEAELAERRSKVVNREDAIATFDRVAVAFKVLVNGRFRTQIIEGLQLTPDKVGSLDAALGEICGVMDKGFDAFR